MGKSVPCKRCHNFFTLAANDDAGLQAQAQSSSEFEIASTLAPPAPPRLAAPPQHSGAPHDEDHLAETVRHEPLTAPVMPALPEPPPARAPAQKAAWHAIGVTALFLGSVGLVCASVPGVQWLTIPLSALGLIAGAFGLMVDYSYKTEEWTPKVGAGLCALLLVAALAWPALLGLDPKVTELPPPVDPNRQVFLPRTDRVAGTRLIPQAVGKEQWVDAEAYDVDHGIVRLRVAGAMVQDVPVNQRKDRRRAERELTIALTLSHAGVKDPIVFKGWRSVSDAPRLVDAAGQALAFRPRPDSPPRSVLPFHPVQETIAFDVPAAGVEFVRLELPASAFGGAGMVRFQLPKSMFAR